MLKTVAVALFLVSTATNAASFDCNKAFSKTEKLICNTPALSQADDALYVDYLQAKVVTGNNDDFKKLVKQNWKLREKNCDTEKCLLNWYERSTELYRQIAENKSTNSENRYLYGIPVKIKGTLTKESAGFPSLRLNDLISVFPQGGDEIGGDNTPEFGVAVMQLAMSDDTQWNIFEKFKGQDAVVTCGLYHSHTAHHNTPVLCSVMDISPIKTSNEKPVKIQKEKTNSTIDDFFADNPELSNNIYIKQAVKDVASGQALSDAFTSKPRNVSTLRARSDNLSENGYDYARLAVRTLQDSCQIGVGSGFGLRENECRILSRYQDSK
ncbi:DUF4431 domain-containing protein [Xenorhabdus bovienii]|uniref:DUF4431 domain-containing protein n=1 Tax=Xenorhabdus bovienii TaxID=40576 RepID=UPI0023B20CDF|nr:DUF4431 domain-containing protein [Xenorhabdus bovienii]MDE9432798.1 DUF4431 domain-containing protein [Xenorhabdus bovienii]MDE9490574.1 DUF4431 domain-containing protein [Xenorhabdus bovienii]MDE9507265.1 DUF4431 domain-containing protein [Xenorhabdus bovienii]